MYGQKHWWASSEAITADVLSQPEASDTASPADVTWTSLQAGADHDRRAQGASARLAAAAFPDGVCRQPLRPAAHDPVEEFLRVLEVYRWAHCAREWAVAVQCWQASRPSESCDTQITIRRLGSLTAIALPVQTAIDATARDCICGLLHEPSYPAFETDDGPICLAQSTTPCGRSSSS